MKLIHAYDLLTGAWRPSEDKFIEPDENGQYQIPKGFTDKPLPQPCWKPSFNVDKNDWIETATEEEKNPPIQPQPKSELEKRLDLMQSAMDDLILGGAL